MARSVIRFLRRGQVVEESRVDPNETLLDYLRLRAGHTGTKEGCAEGDCGACTVVLGRLEGGRITYRPANACITLLAMVDGAELITVDDLAEPDGRLHPVQQALVDHHGSQCGFCTPGMVMSLFALYHAGIAADRATASRWLAGNLCRCTGYGPILDAAESACTGQPDDGWSRDGSSRALRLLRLEDGLDLFIGNDRRYIYAPASIANLAEFYQSNPEATLVAGATDVGLWITKSLTDLPKIIWLGRIKDFDAITEAEDQITIGAGATYDQAEAALSAIDPDIASLLARIGGKQVRSLGTIGGNLANGSPIGDMAPVLIALGATLELQKGGRTRTLPLEDFFIQYGEQDLQPGEFVRAVTVPRLQPGQYFRCQKIAKRRDQDISALLCATRLTVMGGAVAEARVAFGGMAGIPARARATEEALRGIDPANAEAWQEAARALRDDFTPIDDARASAHYRMNTAIAVLCKALMEISGVPSHQTRLDPRLEIHPEAPHG